MASSQFTEGGAEQTFKGLLCHLNHQLIECNFDDQGEENHDLRQSFQEPPNHLQAVGVLEPVHPVTTV